MALSKQPYKGTRDFFPESMRLREYIFQKMKFTSELFGYEPYDGPIVEDLDLYKAKSGEELIAQQIYQFTDRGGREVVIRPEMTPTLARMVAQVHREVSKPIRLYSIPNLMRYERPQRGRLREFWQFNADVFGADSAGEIEILKMSISLLKSFGATQEHFEIQVNDRRFVDFVFHGILSLDQDQATKLYKLIDAKNKMDEEKFLKQVEEITGHQDKAKVFKQFTELRSVDDIKKFISTFFETTSLADFYHSKTDTPLAVSTHVKPLYEFFDHIHSLHLQDYIRFHPSIVRGLDYYTGLVFEIFDKHPDNQRAIAGGGSYANLLQIFNESPLEGFGIGLGEVPLTEFLKSHDLLPDFSRPPLDYLIAFTESGGELFSQEIADHLREKGFRTELYPFPIKPKKVLNYALKKSTPYLIVIGEEELNKKVFKVKNLQDRSETLKQLSDL